MSEQAAGRPYAGPDASLRSLQGLRAQLDGALLTITLDAAEPRGAAGMPGATVFYRLLQAVAADAAVRVVVLRGAGGSFGAGADEARFGDAARLLRALPQPVIGLVQGLCAGAAIGFVEACDIVVCADEAQFVLPDVAGGQGLSGIGAKAASRVMAPRAARFHALTGQPLDGRQAERCGLVTLSLPAPELEGHVQALAAELLGKDPLALRFTKDTLRHVGSMDWDAVLSFNAAKLAELQSLQAGRPSARAAAVESFLAGKSKPGLGT